MLRHDDTFQCSSCVPVLVCPVFKFFFIVQVPVRHPGEIDEIFDVISCSKKPLSLECCMTM